MQPKLPLRGTHTLYECLNPQCFYDGALMDAEDVLWGYKWNAEIGDLDLLPRCPSCRDYLVPWNEEEDL